MPNLSGNLNDIDVKREYLSLLEERANRLKYNRINTLFPDTGPLRRALYVKHLEFFRAGREHKERLFLAGNRCVTPWTLIETACGLLPAAEAFCGKGGNLRAVFDGFEYDAQPVDAHLVGIEPAFRVVLGNGQFFDCSRKHQVLTTEGWLAFDRLVSASSGLHWFHKLEDYQANCVAGGYLCDQPLQRVSGNAQAQPPSQGDAQKRGLIFSHEDAAGRIPQCNHVYQPGDRLSSLYDQNLIEALFEPFSVASVGSGDLPLTHLHRGFRQLAAELSLRSGSSGPVPLRQFLERAGVQQGSLYFVGANKTVAGIATNQDCRRLNRLAPHNLFYSEFGRNTDQLSIFYPCKTPELVGGQSIVAIVPLGCQPIIDVHVPDFNNYKAAGVYHHNCGKSEAGGYELALHLTGLYPKWWEGYRFDRPIKAMAAGDTGATTRDILQAKMLGDYNDPGTGLIPKAHLITDQFVRKSGIPNAFEQIAVKHVSGWTNYLWLRSYEQGRKVFQGFEQDYIWLDEEVPEDVYSEALIRTMTTQGLMTMTYTPVKGLTKLTLAFMRDAGMVS